MVYAAIQAGSRESGCVWPGSKQYDNSLARGSAVIFVEAMSSFFKLPVPSTCTRTITSCIQSYYILLVRQDVKIYLKLSYDNLSG